MHELIRSGAWKILTACLAGVILLSGCGDRNRSASQDKTVKLIMSDAGFNSEVVPILKEEVAKQGFKLDWVVVNDIIQPNQMVDQGLADANSFQHEPYFDQFVADHNLKNVVRGFYTLFTPSGLYSKKYKSLDQVPDGALFGIPVDPANNGRALFMLRDKGLLKVKEGVAVTHASLKDITDNPHKYRFKEVDQLMLQRTLDDVDVGFLFSATALKVGFNPKTDALAYETPGESPYKGIVAIRRELVGSPKIKALQIAYGSDALKSFFRGKYGNSIIYLDELNK
ncbi:MAG TPA: MetQ/NlpA family ABC transporter substrate-binding protein [Chthoniobacterales bacterium]